MQRCPNLDIDALRAATRKQALVPVGATVLEPVGTAPGLVSAPASGDGPTVVVLPGPPRELQAMWAAGGRDASAARRGRRRRVRSRCGCCACSGCRSRRSPRRCGSRRPRASTRAAGDHDVPAARRGRGRHALRARRRDGVRGARGPRPRAPRGHAVLRRRHAPSTSRSPGAARPGRDDRDRGVVHRRAARGAPDRARGLVGLRARRARRRTPTRRRSRSRASIRSSSRRHGAVSLEVAEALADGALRRLDADVGVGITGVAGPGGGTEAKPVGFVCLSAASADGRRITRSRAAARRARRRPRPLDHGGHAPRPPAAARRGRAGTDRRLRRAALRGRRHPGRGARAARLLGRGRPTPCPGCARSRRSAAPHARVPRVARRRGGSGDRRARHGVRGRPGGASRSASRCGSRRGARTC